MIGLTFPTFGPSPTISPATISLQPDKPASGGLLEIFKPKPSGGSVADLGSAVTGAGSGAASGAAISGGNPIGAAIGAGVGFLNGLLGSKGGSGSASNGGGLTDALAAGLSSLGLGSKTQPQNVTQVQSVTQGTSVNLTNVLGGRAFGNVDESGNFDTFQAISDVFAIKAYQDSARASEASSYVSSAPAVVQDKKDYTPLLLLAAGAGALYLIFGRKK